MMSGEAWLYLLAVLINAVNLFLQVFFTIMYSDLEWFVLFSMQMLSRNFRQVSPRPSHQITIRGSLAQSWQSYERLGTSANSWCEQ
jgi:hypothetical protein